MPSFVFRYLSSFKLTGGIIWLLEKIHDTKPLDIKLAHLRTLDKGTVGRGVAELLDTKNYRLIPRFENHDLKHLVLEYDMTMADEIMMQAYLVGNGNTTFPCLVFLSLGIFYPSVWKALPNGYRRGRTMKSIHLLTLDDCKNQLLAEIKNEYGAGAPDRYGQVINI